jgi:predicted transcriptional regulator of viral defense system
MKTTKQVIYIVRLAEKCSITDLMQCTGKTRSQIRCAVTRLSGQGRLEPLGKEVYKLGHHEQAVDNS